MATSLAPGLYLVATPIGNLGDLSPRAAETLRGAGLILAEDTRVTGKLLKRVGSSAPMLAHHEHNEAALAAQIVPRLAVEAIALVSDAGTPLISDPGFRLVRSARAAGATVCSVPGPCAFVAALSVSGLPTDRFLFAGFLPAKAQARAQAISELAAIEATLVFYEAPQRLGATLAALAAGLGDRPASVSRELTKLYEETVTGSLGELAVRYGGAPPRGEIAIVVGPPLPPAAPDAETVDAALASVPPDTPVGVAAAELAQRFGLPRRDLYARLVAMRQAAERYR
ncbi:MAG: 16S rRNA (cytidine(1402)-2'-O)-methyltransferase [Sphingomonadaceae bacterium]|nr:16S rRNA (cytidine(1402)-2'-O)-methyltransferase [Sphingomonadaceae bacterium]